MTSSVGDDIFMGYSDDSQCFRVWVYHHSLRGEHNE